MDSVGQDVEWRSGLDRENRFADRLCRPRRGNERAEQDAVATVDDDRNVARGLGTSPTAVVA